MDAVLLAAVAVLFVVLVLSVVSVVAADCAGMSGAGKLAVGDAPPVQKLGVRYSMRHCEPEGQYWRLW